MFYKIPNSQEVDQFTPRMTLPIAIILFSMLFAGCPCSSLNDHYHPPYPPTSPGVVDITEEDIKTGKADYLKYEGIQVRVVQPTIAVWDQMRFSKISIKIGDAEMGIRSWNDRELKIISVRHIKVLKQDPEFPKTFWYEHVDLLLESPAGEKKHWLWGVFPNLGRSRIDPDISSDPVEDSINQFFIPIDEIKTRSHAREPNTLLQLLKDTDISSLPEPPPAPPVTTVSGEEREAALRLLQLLDRSPGEGIMEAHPYAKNYAFHEVAEAVVEAMDKSSKIAQRQGNTYQECAMSVLGTIADPVAVDPLIRMLEDPYRYHRRKAMEALGRIGSNRAMGPLYRATFTEKWVKEALKDDDPSGPPAQRFSVTSEERINAITALRAMCSVIGVPESRDFCVLRPYQEATKTHPASADARLKYAALCFHNACMPLSSACDARLTREAVKEFKIFLQLEPEGPRAIMVECILEATGRLLGM
jgi:hypothetical protein